MEMNEAVNELWWDEWYLCVLSNEQLKEQYEQCVEWNELVSEMTFDEWFDGELNIINLGEAIEKLVSKMLTILDSVDQENLRKSNDATHNLMIIIEQLHCDYNIPIYQIQTWIDEAVKAESVYIARQKNRIVEGTR